MSISVALTAVASVPSLLCASGSTTIELASWLPNSCALSRTPPLAVSVATGLASTPTASTARTAETSISQSPPDTRPT